MPDDETTTNRPPAPPTENVDARFTTTTEFVIEAQRRLPPPIWDYISGGSESETTLKRNRQALDSVAFRPRVLRKVVNTELSRTFLGQEQRIPVMLAPMGGMKRMDPEGSLPAARAAKAFGVPYMMSTVTDPEMEEVAEAAGERFYFQLYTLGDQAWVNEIARRASACGCKGFAVTVDTAHYSRRERNLMNRFTALGRERGGYREGDEHRMEMDWDFVDRLKDVLDMPLMLKGIATAEDSALAVEHGVDVVYISNHGGRQLDHGRGALEVLPEVVEAVDGKAEIVIDGGFARGTDILKAVALGADMVAIGRLQAWALAAAGEAGVRRLLDILERELMIDMKLLGVNKYDELDHNFLHPAAPVDPPSVVSAFPLVKYWEPKSKSEL